MEAAVSKDDNCFVSDLESRLQKRSDELEEIHMEAAIDAQVSAVGGPSSNAKPVIASSSDDKDKNDVMFDDFVNPNSVNNCLSPYVPTSAERLDAFVEFSRLKPFDKENKTGDVLLDIGCGDGRVCIAAAKLSGCRAVGIDVSPPCISMARVVAKAEGLQEHQCSFYEADATIDPDILLADSSPLASVLKSVTVIYLYTYPTLLVKLVPLLCRLTDGSHNVHSVVTLTYHLPAEQVTLNQTYESHDMKLYSQVREA